MGELPSWYRLLKAAQYLRVAPWDLAKAPTFWVYAAEQAQTAEAHADAEHARRHALLNGG